MNIHLKNHNIHEIFIYRNNKDYKNICNYKTYKIVKTYKIRLLHNLIMTLYRIYLLAHTFTYSYGRYNYELEFSTNYACGIHIWRKILIIF